MKKYSASKWIISFICCLIAIMLLLAAIAFVVDPFMQFRIRDNTYMLQERYVSAGLVKNYDYDTLIVGSSMIQNFDMDVFRKELGGKPLHIGVGGMQPPEIIQILHCAYETQKADKYFVGIDLMAFQNENKESHIPQYLLKDDLLSKLRYLLSYEVWFRYLPVDVAFVLADQVGVELPAEYANKKSIDKLGNWSSDYPVWGEQVVIDNYITGKYEVSKVDSTNLLPRITSNIDKFFNECDFEKGEHIFFFPPYSSLCWAEYQNRGQFEIYLQAKQYFIEKAMQHNLSVYDFQGAEFTMDLSNYKDTTHYMSHINDWMVKCFANKEYLVTRENAMELEQILIENTQKFRNEHPELFS
ncbi:MAG: hypothetical protein J6Q30_03845 [Oscillospiraceae bacterium]|nr:hypothetical protein [Oscillospiraceae bacterium]